MTTRIGICTRYDRHEGTYVATIIADWLVANCFFVSMFIVPGKRTRIKQGKSWDTAACDGNKVLFSDWVAAVDIVVWIVQPQPEQVTYLLQHKIKSYVIYDFYDVVVGSTLEMFKHAAYIIALNRACAVKCANWSKVNRPLFLPLAPGNPIYQRRGLFDSSRVTVLWPIFDGDWMRYGDTANSHIDKMLREHAGTFFLNIVVSSADIPVHVLRPLQIWRKLYPDTVRLITCRNSEWRDMHYQTADVMFWPSRVENAMLRGLQAYSYGVPVVGFMASPVSELLAANPTLAVNVAEKDKDSAGYIVGDPHKLYAALVTKLIYVIQSPAVLAEASMNATRFIKARGTQFSAAMNKLFK